MTDRAVCIHGHFYQPPRENPWLEAIEQQDSAEPYHDWNERITAECYAQNGASRLLDGEGRIRSIVNNYARMSFNFGPTLLSWMEQHAPTVYAAILRADAESRERFSGHGSAIAQVYNHMILPLANRRDRRTQVLWGIRDFERRFGRKPEGLWLAETAVDRESLDILAAEGIRFTILAPSQARRVRRIGSRSWRDVSGGGIDPTRAYIYKPRPRRRIAVFFYDGPVARAVAFEGLLSSGERFADRLRSTFVEGREHRQLSHIATDGESYGHHHRHGDMALARALEAIEADPSVRLTNYGEFLEDCPPAFQADIVERSSWSCAHGVDRWWSDCGCRTGGRPEWIQAWRTPLREALDDLRDTLAPVWERAADALLKDPWAARDGYIAVVLDRSRSSVDAFLDEHARGPLSPSGRVSALKLLELQRHAMLMYTSCGWFFDELSGIETVQVMQYAGRAVQLAREVLDIDPEPELLRRLGRARSNLRDRGDGAAIYERAVKPALVDLPKVGAHYAISSLFEEYGKSDRIYCYSVERGRGRQGEAGRARLATGRVRVTSAITEESATLDYAVTDFGDHNVQAGVRPFADDAAFEAMTSGLHEAFGTGEHSPVLRQLDRHFEGATSSLRSLFRDEQRRIVGRILSATLQKAESRLRDVHENHAALLRFLGEIGMPQPKALRTAAEFVTNAALRRELEEEAPDRERILTLLESAAAENIALDTPGLAYALQGGIRRITAGLRDDPGSLELMERLESLVRLERMLPFEADLWEAQNLAWDLLQSRGRELGSRTDEKARDWLRAFRSLAEALRLRVA